MKTSVGKDLTPVYTGVPGVAVAATYPADVAAAFTDFLDGAGVADQFPQGVEVHTAWRIDGQAQRVGEVLLIHESNARG